MEEISLIMQSNGFSQIKDELDTNTLIKDELEKTVNELTCDIHQLKSSEKGSFMKELLAKKESHRVGLNKERINKELQLIAERMSKLKEEIAKVSFNHLD
jgi:archaellum component FlaC